MKGFEHINIDEYNYDLPEERIAQYPVKERDASKLLIYRNGDLYTDIFRNIPRYLTPDNLLVFNDTRVINARLLFKKDTGSNIEILLIEPLSPSDYDQVFSSHGPVEWKCMIGNLKKWKKGFLSGAFSKNKKSYILIAEKVGSQAEAWRIRLKWKPDDISFGDVELSAGHIPLPPYINRKDEESDYIRYQTVYGLINGSVAAPTAGLHFTEKVLENILNKGISTARITLHVGAGTFQPVRTNDITKHEMHCEHISVKRETIEALLQGDRKVIAIGTTCVRTLESLYWLGKKASQEALSNSEDLFVGQWEPYMSKKNITVRKSLESLLDIMDRSGTDILHAATRIIIIPGYEFKMINGMVTNFHQPGSTLLLLVSAWLGKDWKKIYDFAINNNYRFLSYGDSSLLIK